MENKDLNLRQAPFILKEVLQASLEDRLEKSKVAVPLGTQSKDGKYVKTDSGWKHISSGHKSHKVTLHVEHNGRLHKKEINGVLGRSHQEVADRAKKILEKLHGRYGSFTTHRLKIESTPDEHFNKSISELTDSVIVNWFEKAMIMTNVLGVNLNTNEASLDESAIKDNPYLKQIQSVADGMKPGDEPVTIKLLGKELKLEKLDDGLFTGYVREMETEEGEFGKLLVRMPDMGLASIIHALALRGYIPKGSSTETFAPKEINQIIGNSSPSSIKIEKDAAFEIIEDMVLNHEAKWDYLEGTPMEQEEDARLLDLVRKLLTYSKSNPDEADLVKARPAFPVGTERVWGGQKYVKHADGWVAVGGKHHGKKMGAFNNEATHKDYADQYHEKTQIKEEEKPKEEDPEKKDPPESEPGTSPVSETPKKEETPTTEQEGVSPDSPREDAEEARKEEEASGEYEFARQSQFGNKGEDLKNSARHKRNQWRGLEEAEKDGTAAEMVKRDILLKENPIDYNDDVTADNYQVPLAMYLALKKFPATPKSRLLDYYKNSPDTEVTRVVWKDKKTGKTKWYHPNRSPYDGDYEKAGEHTKADLARENRKEYVDTFNRLREKADHIVKNSGIKNPGEAITEFKKEVSSIIGELREKDNYSDTANYLISFHNNVLSTYRSKGNNVLADLMSFKKLGAEKYGESEEALVNSEKMADHAKQVIEGDSVEKAFGKSKKEGRFSAVELYLDRAERKGPEEKDLQTVPEQEKFMMSEIKLRGLQWGNSVSDEERQHHLKEVTLAFKDLLDILELPEEMGSFNNRLGLAIGARGKGNALAHYEPNSRVINLTRKKGVGSLAHEWGHFFDNILNELHSKEGHESGYLSEMAGVNSPEVNDRMSPVISAMSKLVESSVWKDFRKRLREDGQFEKLSGTEKVYWASTREMFARSFEKHIGFKLEKAGRKNTYLAGVKPHPFWPLPEECQKLSPLFDAIFNAFKNSDMLKKALDLLALGEVLAS